MNDAYDIILKAYELACNTCRHEISRLELIQSLPSNNPDADDDPVYVQGKIDAYKAVIDGMEEAIEIVKNRRTK